MSKRKGKAISIILFILLFALAFSIVSIVFLPHPVGGIRGFYEEPENSIDVLFVGSSPVLDGCSPLVLWHEYGITSYNRAWSVQAPYASYNFIKETLETQSPKLVVWFVPKLFEEYKVDVAEPYIREGTDYLPFSEYKADIIRETLENSEKQTLWSYVFPLLRYHDRWKDDLSAWDLHIVEKIQGTQHVYRGEYPHFKATVYEGYDLSKWDESEAIKKTSEFSEEYIGKTVEFLREEEIPLLIVEMPRVIPEYGRHLAFLDIAERYQVDVLDLAVPEVMEEIGLDLTTDFYDESHLSAFGAEKTTKYLGEYLAEHYDLPDRRGESGMERWDADYEQRQRKSENALARIEEIRRYPDENVE